ncbi:transposase [Cerasicoccus maritimus]|uniref:transposase n=1 Tax=Cerasicoccus maritimus TaxID=490089 RepID=UPI0028529E9B|nr:transposase [Cerasicoccus maritimus]
MKKRRKFTSEFKSKVALEAQREQEPLHEISKRYQIHPTQVTEWKKALLSNASSVYEHSKDKHEESFK